LVFWRNQADVYPNVSMLSRVYLTPRASSVPVVISDRDNQERSRAGAYLRGVRDQTPKCSPQKFSTLFQHISAVAVVNIVTISRSIAFSFHLKRSVTLKKC